MKTAREITILGLLSVNEDGGYSNIVLDKILKGYDLSAQDKGFVGTLFYGVIERKLTLDFCISKYSKIKIKKMSPAVREILRIGFYQLIYMGNIPQSAIVNECVNLTKVLRVKSASGFVNGVLRSFIRDDVKIPKITGDEIIVLSKKYSCGKEIVQLLLEQYKKQDVIKFLENSLEKQKIYARVNITKTNTDNLVESLNKSGVAATKCEDIENAVTLSGTGSLSGLEEYKNGLFHIQDKSSQICSSFVGATKNDKVLDVCSAPGGKTFTISQNMDNKGEIVACDIHEHKIELIDNGANRLGLCNIKSILNDGALYNKNLGMFDKILCDVPCSGIGIISKKPEIKYKSIKEIDNLPDIQYNILKNSSKYLLDGGILVYSTCSINKNENEKVIEKFLQENKDFSPYNLDKHENGGYFTTFLPSTHNCDGFFVATLIKQKTDGAK